MVLEGHCRLGRWRGLKRRYFFEGSLSLLPHGVQVGLRYGYEWGGSGEETYMTMLG